MQLFLLDILFLFDFSIEVYFILLVIAVPVFFTCRWILKKFIEQEGKWQIITWLATIIVTPLLYIGLIWLFILTITYTPSKDFDEAEWQTNPDGRFQMLMILLTINCCYTQMPIRSNKSWVNPPVAITVQ